MEKFNVSHFLYDSIYFLIKEVFMLTMQAFLFRSIPVLLCLMVIILKLTSRFSGSACLRNWWGYYPCYFWYMFICIGFCRLVFLLVCYKKKLFPGILKKGINWQGLLFQIIQGGNFAKFFKPFDFPRFVHLTFLSNSALVSAGLRPGSTLCCHQS